MPNRSDQPLENPLRPGRTLGSGTEAVHVISRALDVIHSEFVKHGIDLTAMEADKDIEGFTIARTVNHLYDNKGRISKVIERIKVLKIRGDRS